MRSHRRSQQARIRLLPLLRRLRTVPFHLRKPFGLLFSTSHCESLLRSGPCSVGKGHLSTRTAAPPRGSDTCDGSLTAADGMSAATLRKGTTPSGGTEREGPRVRRATQNGAQCKIYKLFTSGIVCLLFSDRGWLQVPETAESKDVAKGHCTNEGFGTTAGVEGPRQQRQRHCTAVLSALKPCPHVQNRKYSKRGMHVL